MGDRELFCDLSWHIKPGERVGLVGDNGAGKTTLLRMACGELDPDSGQVVTRRGARIGFLRQEIHVVEGEESVLFETMKAFEEEQQASQEIQQLYEQLAHVDEQTQNELLGRIHILEQRVFHHDSASAEADARRILAGLGFAETEFDKPLSQFSGGWQMRAHIARLLLEQPDLLLLDEPTNHLDLESIEWLESFLTGFKGAMVVVSHDRYFLDRMTNRTSWLYQKRVRNFAGSYSKFVTAREEEEEQLRREYENQQKEIEHIERFIERFRYKATKATAVQSRVKMLEKIERIELPASARKVRLKIPTPAPVGQRVIELRGVGAAYGEKRVFSNVNLLVDRGDKIALVGKNGAGKSTLLKVCAGVLDYEGVCQLDTKTQLEYFSQHRIDMLNPENTVLEEARPTGADQTDEQLRALLGCFLFSGDDVFKPVSVLSGGEKSRLALARMMLRRGNLLLLDEPTNHLDISTRQVLQEALREFPGTLIMISHDRAFIDAVVNKTVEVGGGKITVHLGNYSEYLQKKAELAQLDPSSSQERSKASTSGSVPSGAMAAIELAKAGRTETRRAAAEERRERTERRVALKTRLDQVQDQIEKMEVRLGEIHALQADPEAYTAGKVTPEICAEGKRIESELPELLQEWETLVEEYEQARAANSRG